MTVAAHRPSLGGRPVDAAFFSADTLAVARALVGATLWRGSCAVVIVETEGYADDAASHFVTRPKTAALMGTSFGLAYVYRIYGVHCCLNVTTDGAGPGAVLLRAGEPIAGLRAMRRRRGDVASRDLARGPGRLAQALGAHPGLTGRPFAREFRVVLPEEPQAVDASRRVGVSAARDLPWRFSLRGSPFVSVRAGR